MKTEDIDKLIGMPDVDKEWEKFWGGLENETTEYKLQNTNKKKKSLYFRQRRIAAIIAAVFSLSLVAVASVWMISEFSESPKISEFSEYSENSENSEKAPTNNDTLTMLPAEPLIFDNVEMQEIATAIGNHYNVKTEFKNEEAKHVRLYLQIDNEKTLAEVVELLNNFHKLHFIIDGEKLIIE